MAALVTRAGPVGDLLPPVAGSDEHPLGRLVAAGLHIVVGVTVRGAGQRGTWLDRQRIRAQVGWGRRHAQQVGETALPVPVTLPRPTEDQVEVPRVEPLPGHQCGGRRDVLRSVAPAEALQHVSHGGLHTEGDTGHPGRPVRGEQPFGHVLRIALDRHFGPRRPWHRGEHLDQEIGREPRGCPAAEEHRGRRSQGLPLDRPCDLDGAGRRIHLHQVVPVGVGGEGAVVAPVAAERHVDVDPERLHPVTSCRWGRRGRCGGCSGWGRGSRHAPHRHALTVMPHRHARSTRAAASLASCQRSRASARSTAWSTIGAG